MVCGFSRINNCKWPAASGRVADVKKKQRLQRSLSSLILYQFVEFWPYYLGALFCLTSTHWIQSHLPFLGKKVAEQIELGSKAIETRAFVQLAVGTIFFRTLSRLLFFYPARVLQKNLRIELLDRLEEGNPSRYRHYSDGQVFQILSSDMEQLRALIGFALLQVGNILVAAAVLIPKLGQFNSHLVLALIPLLIAFLLFTAIVSGNHALYRKNQDMQGEVQNIIMESYAGKPTIKNFHAEESFIRWFGDYSWRELRYFYRAGIRVGFSIPLVPLGVGLSLLWGASIIRTEDLGTSGLVLFSSFIFLFLEPMMFLSWIGVVFTRSYGAWRRIVELVGHLERPSRHELDLQQKNPRSQQLPFVLDFWGRPLSFQYSPQVWTVLVGKTGCGKSHLLIQIADVFKWRQISVNFLAQNPYLYSDTIEKNIFLGRTPSEKERRLAGQFLNLLALDVLAGDEQALLNLEVGENGKYLSGGQAKRVALVRSLMSDAEVLLWDDPFSSVDLILEKQIIDQLRKNKLMYKKTVILTSHRMTTVKCSEEVFLLGRDEGIIESGKVKDLLVAGKQTYEHFEKQMV